MTVNSAVGILVTRRCDKKRGFEYRVAYMPDTDGLSANPDYPSMKFATINREFTLKTFSNSRIIYNEADAFARANWLETKYGPTDKGVIRFNYANINFPANRPWVRTLSRNIASL